MKSRMLLVVACLLIWSACRPATCRAQAEVSPDHFELTNVEPLSQPVSGVTGNAEEHVRRGGAAGSSVSSSGTTLSPKSASPGLSSKPTVKVSSRTAALHRSAGLNFQDWVKTTSEVISSIAFLTYKTALLF